MIDPECRILALLAPGGLPLSPDVAAVLTEAREALRDQDARLTRQAALLTTVRELLNRAGVPELAAAGPQEITRAIPLDERLRWLIGAAGLAPKTGGQTGAEYLREVRACIAIWRGLGHPNLVRAAKELEDRVPALRAEP